MDDHAIIELIYALAGELRERVHTGEQARILQASGGTGRHTGVVAGIHALLRDHPEGLTVREIREGLHRIGITRLENLTAQLARRKDIARVGYAPQSRYILVDHPGEEDSNGSQASVAQPA